MSSPLLGLSFFSCTDGVTPSDAQRPREDKPRLRPWRSPRCPAHCKNDQGLLRTDAGRPVLQKHTTVSGISDLKLRTVEMSRGEGAQKWECLHVFVYRAVWGD